MEFNTARQRGQSLKQLIEALTTRAHTEPEAALLLRDLWEVSMITEHALERYHPPDRDTQALMASIKRMLRVPFGGEEVLF